MKKIRWTKNIRINWITIFITLLLVAIIVLLSFFFDQSVRQNQINNSIKEQLNVLIEEKTTEEVEDDNAEKLTSFIDNQTDLQNSGDALYLQYYRELSDKTDEAIGRIITIVSIIAGVLAIFGILFAFRAPKDIDDRMKELKLELLEAKEAAEEARYQAEISHELAGTDDINNIMNLTSLVTKHPEKYDAYVYRGLMKSKIGDYDGAILDMQIALRKGLEQRTYYNNLGGIYFEKNEYSTAIKYYTRAIDNLADEYYYTNRGAAYHENGDDKEAIKDYKEALTINPEFTSVYYFRFCSYKNLAKLEKDLDKKNEYEEFACVDLDMAYKSFPKNPQIKVEYEKRSRKD